MSKPFSDKPARPRSGISLPRYPTVAAAGLFLCLTGCPSDKSDEEGQDAGSSTTLIDADNQGPGSGGAAGSNGGNGGGAGGTSSGYGGIYGGGGQGGGTSAPPMTDALSSGSQLDSGTDGAEN